MQQEQAPLELLALLEQPESMVLPELPEPLAAGRQAQQARKGQPDPLDLLEQQVQQALAQPEQTAQQEQQAPRDPRAQQEPPAQPGVLERQAHKAQLDHKDHKALQAPLVLLEKQAQPDPRDQLAQLGRPARKDRKATLAQQVPLVCKEPRELEQQAPREQQALKEFKAMWGRPEPQALGPLVRPACRAISGRWAQPGQRATSAKLVPLGNLDQLGQPAQLAAPERREPLARAQQGRPVRKDPLAA